MFVFPVPAVTISAGDMLSDELIVERKLAANAAALRMYHTSRAGIAGKVARRTIPAGSAIPVNALRDAYVFREGERVTLELAIGGLSIRGTGVALQPGIVGQTIRVRNIDTGVIVSGVVRSDGSVEVGGS
jgi:flagella basal body P-ring formation protein FlgA